MLIFSSSDKGGTGRSVTSCNLAYRLSRQGLDVAYLDFDFGSPTAGAIFEIPKLERGTPGGGLHSYILGDTVEPRSIDVRGSTERPPLRERPPGAGKLVLYPGDIGGAEFHLEDSHIKAAVQLFRQVEQKFDICIVDLSAGRSAALDMSLHAVGPKVRKPSKSADDDRIRWLLFHRWTTQHVIAAGGLLFGKNGIVECAMDAGFSHQGFTALVRTVRTAVPDFNAFGTEITAEQERWLRSSDDHLKALAKAQKLGQDLMVGHTPLEPMLLWREQIVMDVDVNRRLANPETAKCFDRLATSMVDNQSWEGI